MHPAQICSQTIYKLKRISVKGSELQWNIKKEGFYCKESGGLAMKLMRVKLIFCVRKKLVNDVK